MWTWALGSWSCVLNTRSLLTLRKAFNVSFYYMWGEKADDERNFFGYPILLWCIDTLIIKLILYSESSFWLSPGRIVHDSLVSQVIDMVFRPYRLQDEENHMVTLNIKDILYSRNKISICYLWDTPVVTAVRSKLFFRVRWIVFRLTGSSKMIFISS